jgi:hypothetical protein
MAKRNRINKSGVSKIDQIFEGLMKTEIKAELQPYYDKMVEVQSFLRQGYTTRQCVLCLVTTHQISHAFAYEIHNDAVALFGKTAKLVDKEGKRQIHIERALRQQQEAEKKGNAELWFKLERHICALEGLLEDDNVDTPQLPPVQFVFTSNAQVLQQNNINGKNLP